MIKDQGLKYASKRLFWSYRKCCKRRFLSGIQCIKWLLYEYLYCIPPTIDAIFLITGLSKDNIPYVSMSKFTYYLMVMISFPVMIEIDYILHLWLGENVPDGTAIFTILVILNMLVTNLILQYLRSFMQQAICGNIK